jgi:hypothetical protein
MDVYVGPLTRYATGDWLTIAQQVGLANGVDVHVLRPETPEPVDPARAEADVASWQRELLEALGSGDPWPDSAELPYWTDKPDWDGYGGLLLLAAYTEHPDLAPAPKHGLFRRGSADNAREFEKSEAYQAASKAPTRFRSLLHGTEWWLPVDSGGRAFRAPRPDGNPVKMAPVSALLRELRDLAEALGLTDTAEGAAIRQAGPPPDSDDVMACGRFGLSVFLPLAAKAYLDRQPLLLDY